MEEANIKERSKEEPNQATLRELPSRQKTIKIDIRVWSALKNMKAENETFNDVIKGLLNQRTLSANKGQISLIKYSRKSMFLTTSYRQEQVGIEFEYNDVKSQQAEFTLDLKINKIFLGKKIFNTSVFFGVDSAHKHLNKAYLNLYLKCIALALEKEFRISTKIYFEEKAFTIHFVERRDENFENISKWRKIYYDYNLSEDSFIRDIEGPLRLSEEEKASEEIRGSIINSASASIWQNVI
ncbi:MAG: hypothetical protein QME12_07105 [Nanoarchaeota archaeon]|nr:hypothetical protein [Nanoarchaeota archaeon]